MNNKPSEFQMSRVRLEEVLQKITSLKAGVIGDICLDMYWDADMMRSQLSRETPHHTLPVVGERFSPGAAGNVATNLKAIGCNQVEVCSVIGKDWRGSLLIDALNELEINHKNLLVTDSSCTPAYCKPILLGLQGVRQEAARIDFSNHIELQKQITDQLVYALDNMAEQVDVIAVADQLEYGVVGEEVRSRLREWKKRGKIILVDSREKVGLFQGLMVKPNEVEAEKWYTQSQRIKHIEREESLSIMSELALNLSRDLNAPCCMTLGGKGAFWVDSGGFKWVPTQPANPPIDIVGAGDAFSAAMVSALGVGCEGPEAISFAHLVAAIVVKKIGTTGSANPGEIITYYDERWEIDK